MVTAMKAKWLLFRVVASVLCCVAFAAGVSAAPVALAGHQASYAITLASAASGGVIASAEGAVRYRFADACDGWTVENRTVLRLIADEGDVLESVWAYTSWESKDGLDFRVRVREINDGEMIHDFRGEARLERPGGPGKARFSNSIEKQVELPAGTWFPTAYLADLLDKARDGKRYVPATVFDGADEDNPYRVGAVLGAVGAGERAKIAAQMGLGVLPMWSVQMAYFASGQPAAVPKFEIGANIREDGISDTIHQDMGGLALRLTLESVELFPAPDC